MLTPLLSQIQRECVSCIKLLILSSLMLLLFLLRIAIVLRFVEPVHLSVKGKSIGLTLSSEKCFCPCKKKKKKKKIFNNFCNSNFPLLICPDGSVACSLTNKANIFASYFSASSSLMLLTLPLYPSLTLYHLSLSLFVNFARCFIS